MRDGDALVGFGMAGVTFARYEQPCQARITVRRDGTARLRSAATDIGTGTYTVAAQLTAELLGLELHQVQVEIGDTDFPPAPQSGGSGLATAFSGAIHACTEAVLRALLALVADDPTSPLRGRRRDEIAVGGGRLHLRDDPATGDSLGSILARHGRDELTEQAEYRPAERTDLAAAGSFAARFVEVRIDQDLGTLRVARLVTVVDAGRILNVKTARSQIIGGTVMGIGATLLEETAFDPTNGRITNATFSDYLVPVNADVPDLDVVFVGEPDRYSDVGVKGLGEIGTVGVAPAIANAVYHATGRRLRSLPITVDTLL